MDQSDPWSLTDRDLHDSLRSLRKTDTKAAVATVVDVAGSAYRRPGAKLIEPANSASRGAITAGCLEGPVTNLTEAARESGTVSVETFDLMDSGNGLGLGCNGIIDVLVEPLDDSFDPLLTALADGNNATALTIVESDDHTIPVGARTVITDDGVKTGDDRTVIPESALVDLRNTAEAVRGTGTSTTISLKRDEGDLRVFIDSVEPAPDLILFGSQNDVPTIARFGAQAGFDVTVASPRGARAESDQFPHAHRVCVTHPTDLPSLVENPEHTYVVLLSHNLVDDQLALEALLSETALPYIGLMGPRKRFEEIQEAAEDWTYTKAELDRISTPVGLNLGDDNPTGIAMSVVSEVLAVANDADGGRLSEQSGPIHPRSTLST